MIEAGSRRLARAGRTALLAGLVARCFFAAPLQAQPLPVREALLGAAAEATEPPRVVASPQSVIQVFLEGCVQNDGQPTAVADWALAHGFEPLDALGAGADDLLGGEPGLVLGAPASAGKVLLASTQSQRCVVWAEQVNGPALRQAFQKMASSLGFKGAKLQSMIDRTLATAGVWRHQSQWRYRRAGGDQDFGLGSATTLVDTPRAQLLHFAPLQSTAPPALDGMPSR